MSASVSGYRATRRANLRSSFWLEFRLRTRIQAIVSYPKKRDKRVAIHKSYVRNYSGFGDGRGRRGETGSSPVVLNVEVLRGDGRVDGVVEAFGRRDLVVGRPRTLRVDDRLVYVAPGMGPVRWTCRRAATADERAAVILTVQPKNVASTCQTHRQPLYQRRLVR